MAFVRFVRLIFHCAVRSMNRDSHRMCFICDEIGAVRYFCECGYLNAGRTFDQELGLYGLKDDARKRGAFENDVV